MFEMETDSGCWFGELTVLYYARAKTNFTWLVRHRFPTQSHVGEYLFLQLREFLEFMKKIRENEDEFIFQRNWHILYYIGTQPTLSYWFF